MCLPCIVVVDSNVELVLSPSVLPQRWGHRRCVWRPSTIPARTAVSERVGEQLLPPTAPKPQLQPLPSHAVPLRLLSARMRLLSAADDGACLTRTMDACLTRTSQQCSLISSVTILCTMSGVTVVSLAASPSGSCGRDAAHAR
jgi:hypothetical protein